VFAAAEHTVGMSDANTHAVAQPLGDKILIPAVAGDGANLESDHDAASVRAPIGGGKIAQDAAPDFNSLGAEPNRLGNNQVAVALHLYVAGKLQNALLRDNAGRQRHQQQKREAGWA
jgi:hypothetical protein